MYEAGDSVGEELAIPIERLLECVLFIPHCFVNINAHISTFFRTRAFKDVHLFLRKQIHRPFLKRYLKRDEILKQIAGCDAGLKDALELFSVSSEFLLLCSSCPNAR